MPVTAQAMAVLDQIRRLDQQQRAQHPGSPGLLCVPPEAGRFLYVLAKAMQARRVVEVGMSAGYSGIWLASALKETGGMLFTCERDPEKVKLARHHFLQAGVLDHVTIVGGDAHNTLVGLPGPFDLAFIDAGKPDYVPFMRLIAPKVRRGGVVVADNLLTHREALQEFLEYVQREPGFVSVTVPIGNGFEVTLIERSED